MSSPIHTHPDTMGHHKHRQRTVVYPEGDGKPMAETGPHVLMIAIALLTLRYWYRSHKDIYVGANMFFYYEKGRPDKNVAPDIFVAKGVPNSQRNSYKLWEEKCVPQVIIEFTSPKTKKEDFVKKHGLYAKLGVKEYYLFDPLREYLDPPLRGYKLAGQQYTPLTVETLFAPASTNGDMIGSENSLQGWRLKSDVLQLELWGLPDEASKSPYVLRFFNTKSGKWLADPEQALVENELLRLRLRKINAKAQHEAGLRKAAEDEVKRLLDKLKKFRNGD